MIARHTTRIALTTIAGIILATGIARAAPARGVAHAAAPAAKQTLVTAAQRPVFGHILVNGHGFALYYWSKEKTGTVKCTGQCATVWPPLLIPKGTTPAAHIAGAMGTFGTILRPNKSVQLTYNGKAVYLFMSDTKPNQVLCDGVDGWHAIRATMH